jgi:vesicle-associated membrane protein 7
VYALVARENVVLAEFTGDRTNFPTITRQVLTKISSQDDHKQSKAYNTYVFHYEVASGVTYLTMADASLGRRMPFAFLTDIKNQFQRDYGDRAQTAKAFAMNEEFSTILERRLNHYNKDPDSNILTKTQNQVKDLKKGAMRNIDKVLNRGEKIDSLVDKTDRMRDTATRFNKSAKSLANQMWWNQVKMWAMIAGCAAFVVYLIGAMACGGFEYSGCMGNGFKPNF